MRKKSSTMWEVDIIPILVSEIFPYYNVAILPSWHRETQSLMAYCLTSCTWRVRGDLEDCSIDWVSDHWSEQNPPQILFMSEVTKQNPYSPHAWCFSEVRKYTLRLAQCFDCPPAVESIVCACSVTAACPSTASDTSTSRGAISSDCVMRATSDFSRLSVDPPLFCRTNASETPTGLKREWTVNKYVKIEICTRDKGVAIKAWYSCTTQHPRLVNSQTSLIRTHVLDIPQKKRWCNDSVYLFFIPQHPVWCITNLTMYKNRFTLIKF